MMEHWNVRMLEYWNTGILEYWNDGLIRKDLWLLPSRFRLFFIVRNSICAKSPF